MQLEIQTDRLKLLPYTIQICEEALSSSTSSLVALGIMPTKDWPDLETLDTLPRIINNLNKVQSPTGFESWMVIHKNTNILMGDIGFKGAPNMVRSILDMALLRPKLKKDMQKRLPYD